MNEFFQEIAKQVDDLVRDAVVREHFRQMIEEYGRKRKQYNVAMEALDSENEKKRQAVLNNKRLRDKQAGPPDKDWQWKEEIRCEEHYDENGVCREKEIRACGWFPPSKVVVPNNPWPWSYRHTGELTLEEMLPAQYLLLASCHDCQLSDRPPIITLDLAENCDGVNIYYSYSGRNNRMADKICRCNEKHLESDYKDVIYDLRSKGLLNEQGKNEKQIITHATSKSTNSELLIFTPEIGEIEIVVERLHQIQTHKRSYQLVKKRYDTIHFDVDRFARELRIEIPTNRITDFWQELEDPESNISWPQSVQKLIDDVIEKIEPWWGFIKKYGPDRLRNRKEFKRSLFAVNPAELTWVIRELKKFRKLVETKLKQPAPDNFLPETTTPSDKQSVIVSRGKRNKSPHGEEPKKRSLNQKASKKNRPTATEMENRNRTVAMSANEVQTKYGRLATVSEIMEKTKLTANQIYATASYKEGKIAKTSTKLTAEMTGSSIASSEQFGKNSIEHSRANRLSKSDQLERDRLIDESMADDAIDEKQHKHYLHNKKRD